MAIVKYFLALFLMASAGYAGQGMVVPPDCVECQARLAAGNASVVNSTGVLNAGNLSSVTRSRSRPVDSSPSGQGKVIK